MENLAIRRLVKGLLPLYAGWVFIQAVLLWGTLLLPVSIRSAPAMDSIYVALFIAMAFIVTAYLTRQMSKTGFSKKATTRILMLFTVTVQAGVYIAAFSSIKSTWLYFISTVNLIIFAWSLGSYLGHVVSRPAELVPLCVIMSLADFFSVYAGPTRVMSEGIQKYYHEGAVGMPPLVDFILMKGVVPGYSAPAPLFGVSDWVIAVFFLHAILKFRLRDSMIVQKKPLSENSIFDGLYLPAGVVGLGVAVVAARNTDLFIPALPVMALFFMGVVLVKNPISRELTGRDWSLVAGSVFLMGGMLLGIRLMGEMVSGSI